MLIAVVVTVGCATAPDGQQQEREAIAQLDEAWTEPMGQVCHSPGWDEFAAEQGPPVVGNPDLWALVRVSDQMPADDEIAGWYDELCDSGDGAACTLRALLEFFPAEAEGTRDGDPHAVESHLARGCYELEFGPACTLLVEYVRDYAPDQIGEMSKGDMIFELLATGCMYGDGSSCSTMGHALDREDAGGAARTLRNYVWARGCQQDHVESCFVFGWTVLQQSDDLPCFLASVRDGCERGSHRACEQLQEVTGQICAQSGDEAPLFCDELQEVIPDGEQRPLLAWHHDWTQRCEDGDLFACHVAGRALFTGDDGYVDVATSADHLGTTCGEDMLFDCGVAAGARMAQYSMEGDEDDLMEGFELAERGCLGGDVVACGVAVDMLFMGRVGISDVLEIDRDRQRRIAADSCELGTERGCLALMGHFGREMSDNELREYADRFGTGCEGSSPEAIACMTAAISLDWLDQQEEQDLKRRRQYLELACEKGVATACMEEGEEVELALDDLSLSGDLPSHSGNGAGRPVADTDCVDLADQPVSIDCAEEGGQRLTPEQWRGRYGCGVSQLDRLDSSPEQPVEVCGVEGQLEFLSQLRCADGSPPFSSPEQAHTARSGNIGEAGRCGEIVDLYEVPCPEATYEVYIDLYFCPE